MVSLSDEPIVHRCVNVGVHTVLVLVQCLAWTACAAPVVYVSVCTCTVFGMDNLNSAPSLCTWVFELVNVQVYLLYVRICPSACADLGLCG